MSHLTWFMNCEYAVSTQDGHLDDLPPDVAEAWHAWTASNPGYRLHSISIVSMSDVPTFFSFHLEDPDGNRHRASFNSDGSFRHLRPADPDPLQIQPGAAATSG